MSRQKEFSFGVRIRLSDPVGLSESGFRIRSVRPNPVSGSGQYIGFRLSDPVRPADSGFFTRNFAYAKINLTMSSSFPDER